MNKLIITGSVVVTIALMFYTWALITEVRGKVLSLKLLWLFSLGLLFDVTATCLMILGSSNSPFTVHGFIGYSALTAMIIEVILLWRLKAAKGNSITIPASIHFYTKIAYTWWVLAFISGGMIAAMN